MHEITQSDGLVLHATKAWHGLGTVVEEAPSPREAVALAGLDWTADCVSLQTEAGDTVDGHKAIQRSDTREILSVVGHKFGVVQNTDLADLVYDVAGDSVKIESAGSIRGGRKVWFLAKADEGWDIRGDCVVPYVMFLNGHDGAQSLRIVPTTVRVVCSNTLHAANATSDAWSFKHTGSINERVAFAKDGIRRAVQGLDEMREDIQTLASVDLKKADAIKWFTAVYQRAFGSIPADPQSKGDRKKRTRAESVVGQWLASYEGATGKQAEGTRGTVWSALNAVTEWSDHDRTVRKTDGQTEDQARLHTNWFGPAAEWKARLFRETVAEYSG